jgi:predicted MarR family transcription regulator
MSKDLDLSITEAHYRGWHLAQSETEAMTADVEWALLRFAPAFERWVLQVSTLAGLSELSITEAVILHVIRMQDRPKTAALIARQLNRDDIPNIQYSLRKLAKLKLIRKLREPKGKVYAYEVTERGQLLTDKYAAIRRRLLAPHVASIENVGEKILVTTRLLSLLTGLYDEMSRISGTYSPLEPDDV